MAWVLAASVLITGVSWMLYPGPGTWVHSTTGTQQPPRVGLEWTSGRPSLGTLASTAVFHTNNVHVQCSMIRTHNIPCLAPDTNRSQQFVLQKKPHFFRYKTVMTHLKDEKT